MKKFILDFPIHIKKSISDFKDFEFKFDQINKIIISGMGGSAIAGMILKDIFPELELVIERNYFPNTSIDENTLIISCSYSGNTEETLSYYDYAARLTEHVIVLTTGGELLKKAKKDGIKYQLLPTGFPPRSSLGFSLAFLITLFDKNVIDDVNFEYLEKFSKSCSKENSDVNKLAKKIHNTLPLIISEEDLSSLGYRLKSQLNENSKMLSYNVTIPEMNHNEIVGWENKKISKSDFSLLWIHIGWPKNLDRMKITNEILSNKVSLSYHITTPEDIDKNLTSLFYLINYIDWLSYWCGKLNNVDINSVKSIDILKKKIS